MAIKVSVVVPVYNPGRHIDGLLASLCRQSLPAEEFEAIFVDDGSTDGTPERLEQLATELPHFRVIRIPHSGWPGKPRNVGIDAARGEYVQFVDNDDELGDEALERLWNYAKANGSDVVVGREERRHRRVFVGAMFRENRPKAVLGKDPLLGLLTPHKMFRRAFLLERNIRFLEGPRRLEDHQFVVNAYFNADVISVLADYPCYYWIARRDCSNAGRRPYEWFSYYGYVRDVLDVVEAHTEPGPFRDRLLAHWYRGKGLRKLSTRIVSPDERDARRQFHALHELTEERFPPSVDEHLAPLARIYSALLRAGDFDGYRALAAAQRGIKVRNRLEHVRAAEGTVEFRVTATLAYADGSPLMTEQEAGRIYWRPPVALGDTVPRAALDFSRCASRVSVRVVMRNRSTYQAVCLRGRTQPVPRDPDGAGPVGGIRTVRLNPQSLDGGRPLPLGTWELEVQVKGCGWRAKRLLRSPASDTKRASSRVVVPFASTRGDAELVVEPPGSGRPWRLEARLRPRALHARAVAHVTRRALLRVPRARATARRLRGLARRFRAP